jgi:hypothetical protein
MIAGDTPPVGILLCIRKDHALVECARSLLSRRGWPPPRSPPALTVSINKLTRDSLKLKNESIILKPRWW